MTTLIESTEYIQPFMSRSPVQCLYRVTLTDDDHLVGHAEVIGSPWIHTLSRMKLTGENPIKEARSAKEWLHRDLESLIFELEHELERLSNAR